MTIELLPGHYIDDRHCDNCDKETPHSCRDSNHERDSSADFQECLTCGWYMSGYDRVYSPPLKCEVKSDEG